MPECKLSWSREELNNLQYPIIVEMWDKKKSGRIKREFLKEFSESERKKLSHYYNRYLYRWYLVKGTPEGHVMKADTYYLLKRAVQFFATV